MNTTSTKTVKPTPGRARDFWTYWVGQTISNLGGPVTLFALPLLVA